MEPKSVEKSPRKRKSRVEDVTPTRTPSSRVRGQGLAYLLAMEKGGSKKQLAKVQAQSDLDDTPSFSQSVDPPAPIQTEESLLTSSFCCYKRRTIFFVLTAKIMSNIFET